LKIVEAIDGKPDPELARYALAFYEQRTNRVP
jgi:hypothetical protein